MLVISVWKVCFPSDFEVITMFLNDAFHLYILSGSLRHFLHSLFGKRVRKRPNCLPLPVVAMGLIPHIYPEEGTSLRSSSQQALPACIFLALGGPVDIAPYRGVPISTIAMMYLALLNELPASQYRFQCANLRQRNNINEGEAGSVSA